MMDQSIRDKLYDYQVPHVEALSAAYDANPVIIEPSDTGLGKTSAVCAVAAIKRVGVFVVCPVLVIPTWFDTAERFGVTVLGVANYEIAKLGKYFPTKASYLRDKAVPCPWIPCTKTTIDANGVVTPAVLWTDVPYPAEFPRDIMLVFDEAHRGKNNRTKTAQLLLSLRGAIVPRSHTHNQHIALVSATITDRDEDFRVTACVLGLAQHEKHAYKSWVLNLAKKYPGETFASCVHKVLFPKYGSRMRKDIIAANLDPSKNTSRFDVHFHIFKWMRACEWETDHHGYAHTDVFSQVMMIYDSTSIFRKSTVYAKVYDVSPETEADIMAAHDEIGAAIEALKRQQAGEICPLTIILRARQRLEMLKLPTMVEQAAEWISNGFAVVLFVNFSHSIKTLCSELDTVLRDDSLIDSDINGNEIRPPTAISVICGGQSAFERIQSIRQFQCGESIVAVVNGQSGGTGVSLHHIMRCARPRKSLISPPWSGIMLKQELGRIDRVGALSDSEQVIVYCRGKVSVVRPNVGGAANAALNATPNGADGTFVDGAKRVSIEEIMAATINKKLKTIDMINNGDLINTVSI